MARKQAPVRVRDSEPQANPFELAATVADSIQLVDVAVVECRGGAILDPGHPESSGRLALPEVGFRLAEGRVLQIRQHFRASVPPNPKRKKGPGLEIECILQLDYELTIDPTTISESNFEAFAQINGLFNAWPYWREFAQNLAARMGHPGFVVPVFRFQDLPAILGESGRGTPPGTTARKKRKSDTA